MYLDNVALDSHTLFSFSTGTITPAATAAASAVEQAFTLPSNCPALKPTDRVDVVSPTGSGNSTFVACARVNATFQLVLKIANPTAGSLTHAADSFIVMVVRP